MDLSNTEEAFGIKRQQIVFCRHGIARHNMLDEKGNPPNLNDPDLFDPPLLLEGKKQILDAAERLRIWWHTTQMGEHVELVITSPLTRCLQTTALAFLPGDFYAKETPEPTIACMDLVREAYGMSYPDRRRPKDLLEVSAVYPRNIYPFHIAIVRCVSVLCQAKTHTTTLYTYIH